MTLERPARESTDGDSDMIVLARRDAAEIRSSSTPSDLNTPESFAPPRLPGYAIVREVHCGGQGVVFQAVQESTGQAVAIKLLRAGRVERPAHRARFEREVEILAEFRHPQIVAIRDTGVVGGRRYFVMDYIEGEPIDRFVLRTRPALRELLRLVARVCDAVNAAHLRGVIHRDLKPANVLVRIDVAKAAGSTNDERSAPASTPESADALIPQPMILDFGLAKLISDDSAATAITEERQFLGSLPWASPEQAAGDHARIDLRTDVYSLGVILYQLLTGTFPHDLNGSFREVADRIITDDPIPPRQVGPMTAAAGDSRRYIIDDEIENIVLKCLSKEPERRYQTAGDLAADIRRYLAGEAIEAKRDSKLYVLSKTVRRHRLSATIAAAFVLLILCGTVVSTVFWQRAEHEADQARQQRDKSEAIAQFLEYTLGGVENCVRLGRDPRMVKELMDRASQRILDPARSDAPDPEAELRLRLVIGNVFSDIGEYAAAHRMLDPMEEIARSIYGVESRPVAEARRFVAEAWRREGRLAQAEPSARDAVRMFRSHPEWGPGNGRAESEWFLARILHDAGRTDQAVALLREGMSLANEKCPDIEEHVCFLGELAWMLLQQPGPEPAAEAAILMHEALAICKQAVPQGRVSPWLLDFSKGMLGGALVAQNEFRDAELLLLAAHYGLSGHDGAAMPYRAQVGLDFKRDILERIVGLYQAWNAIDPGGGHEYKAAAWRAKLLEPQTSPQRDEAERDAPGPSR